MDWRVSPVLVFFNGLAMQLIEHIMTLHSNLLHMYIVVVSSNVPLAEQKTQISYVPSQSPECMSAAFWYLPPLAVSHPHVRASEPRLLRHNFTSDVTAGAPGWPHLEDRKLLELLLELLGPFPWSPAMPRSCTQFQHFLIHPCLKSYCWCSSKISFSSPWGENHRGHSRWGTAMARSRGSGRISASRDGPEIWRSLIALLLKENGCWPPFCPHLPDPSDYISSTILAYAV